MVTSGVEVEDAEKQDFDVGNDNVQDPESKCLNEVNNQGSGESAVDVYSADMVVGDVTESENGEGVLEQRDGAKEETAAGCQILHNKNEACETKEVDRFNGQLIFNKIDDKETQMDDQGQAAAENLAQTQNDADNGAIEGNSAIVGVGEMDVENGMGSGHLDVSMEEENPDGETAAEKTGERDGNCIGHVAEEELSTENNVTKDDQAESKEPPCRFPSDKDSQYQNGQSYKVSPGEDDRMEDADKVNECNVVKDEAKEQNKILHATDVIDGHNDDVAIVSGKHEGEEDSSVTKQNETSTPNSTVGYSAVAGEHGSAAAKPVYTQAIIPLMAEDDNGTPEEQAAFMKEIESFYRAAAIDFKPPKFYGQPLNCLKLWRAVIRLGGYDRVTGSKLWRQVGESFHPPKTCTTVSWTFRIFYEKSLLEFERHKTQSGELQLPVSFPEASGLDIEGNGHQGSGRARRDAAARAMQGWHQRLSTNGEVGEPVFKDKSLINMEKREKGVKGMGSLKQKRPNEVDHPVKAARIETPRQLAAQVIDIGPPADWVKINVRETKDCFEVYCLVPGLLREEVRVQSDPAGRLVITGQPEQVNNPWGITPFKKVVSFPGRIDPLQTSAVVSLHGRLFVRVPFEKPHNI